MNFSFFAPCQILFGSGVLEQLSTQRLPGKKALVVISCGKSVRNNGSLDTLLAQLAQAGVEAVLFDKVAANPILETIDAGGALCREQGCDFIVALGGGSVIDSGKMIALLATNGDSIWDYVQTGTGGKQPIVNDPLPIVSITTTAGTGSEVNAGASFTRTETNEKIALKDPRLIPTLAVIDPALAYSLPPTFTAYQGWDALTHGMEYLLNKTSHALCDIAAAQAVSYAGHALVEAVNTGSQDAREKMALASCLAGFAIGQGGTSSQHALECAISAIYPALPHGAGLIILSRAYFTMLIDRHVCDSIFIRLAKLLGAESADTPYAFLEAIASIQHQCGVDSLKLRDYGVDKARFGEIVANARISMGGSFALDRYEFTDADCLQILENSY